MRVQGIISSVKIPIYNSGIKDKQKYLSQNKNISFAGESGLITPPISTEFLNIQETPKKIWQTIKNSENIVVFTHTFPDGDAGGSGLALTDVLRREFPRKNIQFYTPNGLPSFLNGTPNIKLASKIPPQGKIDLAIAVDAEKANLDGVSYFEKATKKIIFDHHKRPLLNNISLQNPKAASATIVLYQQLFKPLGIKITPQVAENIVTGIITDTGRLRHSEDGDLSLKTVEELLEKFGKWFSVDSILEKFKLNEFISPELEQLQENLIKNSLSTKSKNNLPVNYSSVSQNLIKQFKVKDSIVDIKSALNLSIHNLIPERGIGIIFWELGENETKVSMRSNIADLLPFVKQFKGGGGHSNSAGFMLQKSLSETLTMVIDIIKKYKF